ncbi:hypothetical protein [Microbacterium sp. No. 7]|uniref:hypothetical protein n=1 Tax=Microbacterium sp. No. 7 TaxID=1714373 RepID=UPI0006D2062D|nr:hypothetical protein [Microbacterium sp. No. 7]ALJ19575.1 hypothetical protein AOA12_06490 [Microbacterium sp. No. 7]
MSDVFPRRNLGPGEQWGRHVEDRVGGIENDRSALRMDLDGLNRATAASLQTLSEQLDEIEALYNAIPKISQHTTESENFGLLTSGWTQIAGMSIAVPAGAKNAQVTVVTSAYLISSSSTSSGHVTGTLLCNSAFSPAIPSAAGINSDDQWYASLSPTYGWTVDVRSIGSINLGFQVIPAASGAWSAGTGSYAALSAFVVFTG